MTDPKKFQEYVSDNPSVLHQDQVSSLFSVALLSLFRQLSQNLDFVEIEFARQISRRSNGIFAVLNNFHDLHEVTELQGEMLLH